MAFVFNSRFLDANARLRREDCEFVKHDKLFSKWKILVGPSDRREGQGAGRNGAGRYHMQNVPAMEFEPGVFELGVTAPSWSPAPRKHNQRAHPLKREDVIPVYIGHAADIRQRLQRFGQAGAHLEPSSRSTKLYHEDEDSKMYCGSRSPTHRVVQSGGGEAKSSAGSRPGLFSEVFAFGSSIAFRWAHADSKAVAAQVQAELLEVFDCAWNRGIDGTRRSRDILTKLFVAWHPKPDSNSSSRNPISSSKRSLFSARNSVGIKVAVRMPQDSPTTKTMMGFNLRFLMTAQVPIKLKCGVITAQGNALPIQGRKHCQRRRVTPGGGTKNLIPATSLDHGSEKRGMVSYGAWRLGFQSCFQIRTKRLHCKKRAAGNNVEKEQPTTVERRRPCSLSFNTWVKSETDDQRVHNNRDTYARVSLQKDMKQAKGLPGLGRTRRMGPMFAPMSVDESKWG